MEEKSFKEKRIKKITNLYYSRPEVQKAIYEFCKNREICPRYFEGFGKRPDSFQYISEVFEVVKKGATSFHCSEELWKEPLDIKTGMSEEEANELRTGWDLLIDIDCPYFDYSKIAAKAIINMLEKEGVDNIGLKYSGSKGFHIIIPWKSFPKEIAGEESKNLFPDLPRKIVAYIRYKSEEEMEKLLPKDFEKQFSNVDIKKGIKCNNCGEIANEYDLVKLYCGFCKREEIQRVNSQKKLICPECKREFELKTKETIYECKTCRTDSKTDKDNFSKKIGIDLFTLMGLDLVLVSPRHLFRTPYSLHEKTSLSSVVINKSELDKFDLKDASPMKVEVKKFLPDSKEGEARNLVLKALDWYDEKFPEEEKQSFKGDYQPIKITDFSEKNFPPCIKRILKGLEDGRKRALFVLINFFRSIGMEDEMLEKIIYDWNKKNKTQLKKGYIKSQISWAYKRKPIMPPNCREFYQAIGVCAPELICDKIKNPINYTIRKSFSNKKKKRVNKKEK
ncbi:MAG: hypothetical protein ACOC1K_00605 [Nanoarchaeota archaeon]